MIGYLGYRAGRGVFRGVSAWWRMYRRNRAKEQEVRPGGPWKAGTLPFICIVPSFIGAVATTILHEGDAWIYWSVFAALLPVTGFLLGAPQRVATRSQTVRKYQPKAPVVTATSLRERAALLNSLQGQCVHETHGINDLQSETVPPAEAPEPPRTREQLLADLFAVSCDVCSAPPKIPCKMGIGKPVALVRKYPVAFCHFGRMTRAVQQGTAQAEDILAQFGGQLPEGVRL